MKFKSGLPETVCGRGSTMELTTELRAQFPLMLQMLGAEVVNDAGCGDMNWMQHVNLSGIDYLGYDHELHYDSAEDYPLPFQQIDLLTEPMRKADVIFCKDVFLHVGYEHQAQLFEMFKASGSTNLVANVPARIETWKGLEVWTPGDWTFIVKRLQC